MQKNVDTFVFGQFLGIDPPPAPPERGVYGVYAYSCFLFLEFAVFYAVYGGAFIFDQALSIAPHHLPLPRR